jgi:hypothetical protein
MVDSLTKDAIRVGFFGRNTVQPKEVVDDGELIKVTLLLPKDTLAIIDEFVKETRIGSRGRLLQILVDDMWQLQFEYAMMSNILSQYATGELTEPKVTTLSSIAMMGVIRRLSRYYKDQLEENPEIQSNDAQRREGRTERSEPQ